MLRNKMRVGGWRQSMTRIIIRNRVFPKSRTLHSCVKTHRLITAATTLSSRVESRKMRKVSVESTWIF